MMEFNRTTTSLKYGCRILYSFWTFVFWLYIDFIIEAVVFVLKL